LFIAFIYHKNTQKIRLLHTTNFKETSFCNHGNVGLPVATEAKNHLQWCVINKILTTETLF